ncbi:MULTISPECIES: MMPL family transporter [Kitasatospora]|uniref:SSD domain-containing protein n=1 Tax=Kitasatospora setae (strain ATCC 33774 / DSM 43861 / JCM 3304 / KCC A-0304 / NBRC 14216 / KM-6054) TaxID=452652 RepID=E4NIQ6_KITSK|nr:MULTISPECIES: MMPL family transporter [Kitasatospora]BAJ32854.1 hypothetical protein KSE_70980 [Kitasatospora setae KM-6054]
MTTTATPAPPAESTHGAVQRQLLRFAAALTGRPKTVLVIWALVIAACFPFASQLNDVLTKQGASKVVPGTSSARADRLVEESFPARSQRESIVAIGAPDVRDARLRALLAELDDRIAARVRTGEVRQSSSAYTLYRDATDEYLKGVRTEVDRQLAAARTPATPDTRRQAVDAAVAGGQLPAALAEPARQAVAATGDDQLRAIAGAFAKATDWRGYPVPVPAGAVSRLLADDGRAALVSVSFAKLAGHDPDVDWLRSAIADAQRAAATGPEVEAHVTGELALIKDTYQKAEDDNALMETVAYAIIFVVLLLFFRAVLPAVLTVAAIGLAMTVSQAALFALGHGVTLTQFTITIMNFVMLGAGVDYSMLLSSRYRQERLAGRPPREAAVHATAHAGESMLLAAVAVVLAFGATLFSPVDWIPPLGYGGLIGIPIVLLAALTLTPALLALLGDRFFWLGRGALADLEHGSALGRHLKRAADLARRRKIAIVLVFAAVTVPFAVITAQHRSTADPVALSPATDSRTGFELVAREWGDAAVLPTLVVGRPAAGLVDGQHRLTDRGRTAVTALTDRLAALPGVARVSAVTRPFGTPVGAAELDALGPEVRRDYLADDGTLRIVVELADKPYTEAAVQTVDRIQDATAAAGDVGPLAVGGATQVDRQYGEALNSSFWQMIGLVSVGVFVMLVFALRSLLIPIRLILTIMMSNVWAIGITVLVFHFWLDRAIIDDLPIFLTVLMMGLGMDYEIFLVTRVRDLVRGGADQETATVGAVVDTGRVINAAGLVMAGSLGTMALSSTVMLQEYGVGLGLAVLLDATLIRMLFVPATLLLFRRYNWWLPSLRRTAPAPAKAG